MDKKGSEQAPKFEVPEFSEGQELGQEKSQEKKPFKVEDSSKGQKKRAFKQKPILPVKATTMPPQAPADDSVASIAATNNTGLTASDVDLIEKHWVERAKAIVANTADNPYQQQNEISKEKTDYIKKRFNKTIPSGDASIP